MKTRDFRILSMDKISPLIIKTPDKKEYPIKCIEFYIEENGNLCHKFLYSIADIETHLGYTRNGWQYFRTRRDTVVVKKRKLSDCKTILSALVETKPTKEKPFYNELKRALMQQKEETISLKEFKIALPSFDVHRIKLRRNVNVINKNVDVIDKIDTAKEANGNQITEFIDQIDTKQNECTQQQFSEADELIRYANLSKEQSILLDEITDLRTQIDGLMSKLNDKELKSKDNQILLSELRNSFANNSLLALPSNV